MTQSMPLRRPSGWWYPYIFVGVFAVVLAVNLLFMYSAIHSFTGLSSDHAYDDGLAYNRVIAQAKAQAELGWTVTTEVVGRPTDGAPHAADVVLTFRDKTGGAVTGLAGEVAFLRPTSAGHDSNAVLAEQGGGRYVISTHLPLGGQWDMSVKARRGDLSYQLAQRIYLP